MRADVQIESECNKQNLSRQTVNRSEIPHERQAVNRYG